MDSVTDATAVTEETEVTEETAVMEETAVTDSITDSIIGCWLKRCQALLHCWDKDIQGGLSEMLLVNVLLPAADKLLMGWRERMLVCMFLSFFLNSGAIGSFSLSKTTMARMIVSMATIMRTEIQQQQQQALQLNTPIGVIMDAEEDELDSSGSSASGSSSAAAASVSFPKLIAMAELEKVLTIDGDDARSFIGHGHGYGLMMPLPSISSASNTEQLASASSIGSKVMSQQQLWMICRQVVRMMVDGVEVREMPESIHSDLLMLKAL